MRTLNKASIVSLILTTSLSVLALAGCGHSGTTSDTSNGIASQLITNSTQIENNAVSNNNTTNNTSSAEATDNTNSASNTTSKTSSKPVSKSDSKGGSSGSPVKSSASVDSSHSSSSTSSTSKSSSEGAQASYSGGSSESKPTPPPVQKPTPPPTPSVSSVVQSMEDAGIAIVHGGDLNIAGSGMTYSNYAYGYLKPTLDAKYGSQGYGGVVIVGYITPNGQSYWLTNSMQLQSSGGGNYTIIGGTYFINGAQYSSEADIQNAFIADGGTMSEWNSIFYYLQK